MRLIDADIPKNCLNCIHGKGLLVLKDSMQVDCFVENTHRFMSVDACCEMFEPASAERARFYADGNEVIV